MDAVGSINQLLYEIVKWGQMLALPISAIAFLAGGILQMTGGAEGGRKARPWYIGSAIGLVVCLGCTAIAQTLQNKIVF
ncbi:hypothetical protein JJB67_15560 [Clostridium perfringens]|uniref:hypothetical protein n=1 Tax=Clostridium perfringens TaxID=1502 RepID=UPI001ABA98D8|nr:hypothetical protein [Clostridium perfringens]MBO3323836.1 hypothetical protein [Clostridium perfringens]MBO3332851.1 hypothetical protein [Clostridium perfringens]MBO3399435.1 hypothetical protein [Clostridium perfringens]MBO3421186.1 hypothetical protein [Clostridium perfringens]